MLIYGTGSKDLGEKFISNEKCPHCGEYNKIHVHGIARYFDVFWIPIFPFRKKIIAICHSCDTEIKKNEISTSLQDKIRLEKSSFRIPIYLFTGLILIGLLIGWLEYSSIKHDDFVENRIHNIQKDDVLVFKNNSKEYSFAIIDSLYAESVFFRNSNYIYTQKPTLSEYTEILSEKSDFYDVESYFYTLEQVDSLHQVGSLDIFE